MSRRTRTPKVRLQFDFTEAAVGDLDELTERLGAASRAETVRRALRLLDEVTREMERGKRLVLRGESGEPDESWRLV